MNIAIRLFAGYFLVVGLAAWFVLDIFSREVEPGARQGAEDTLVDEANLLAEIAAPELASGRLRDGPFAQAVALARAREPGATVWGVAKNGVDLRVYVTDAQGIVRFDSQGADVGADYSRWNDVYLALQGRYGVRSSREDPADPGSSVMYVAAPVMLNGQRIGALSVAKPVRALVPYDRRARDRVLRTGLVLVAVAALIGVAFTWWLTRSLDRLRDYALAVAEGRDAVAPTSGGRQLSDLARALALMRAGLDGKQYVERYVQALTHEMKSPLSAVRANAELLLEEPSAPDRQRFARHIGEQAARMQDIVERLLELARVEQLQAPEAARVVDLSELAARVLATRRIALESRRIAARVHVDGPVRVRGEPFLLEQALGNLVDNAIDFSPDGGPLDIELRTIEGGCTVAVLDRGPGVPDYARAHLFERFYSLPRPSTGRKSTGLGLAFTREVARIHGGRVEIDNREGGGARAQLALPRA